MKVMTLISTAILGTLLIGTSQAEAHHLGGWRDAHRYHGYDYRWDRGRWAHRHQRRAWRAGYRAGRWYHSHDRWALGVGGFATGIVIGSHLNHDHHRRFDHVDARRDRHAGGDWREEDQRRISGCYRIDVLPDGRERRIELPVSECR